MAFKIINKSRQGIPVIVVKKGKHETVNLSYTGVASVCSSDELTDSIKGLEKMGLIKVSK